MNTELRLFADVDYARLPQLFVLLEPEVPVTAVSERAARMRAAGWQCLGVFSGGELVAMAGFVERCHLFSGSVLYVENVAVSPAWRGHGLGQRMMDALADIARERRCSMLTLDAYASNLPARAFYERLGYDPRGVHFVLEL